MGEILDGQLDIAYRGYGVAGVNHVLMYDDKAEHIMSRLGVQIAYIRCAIRRVYDAIVTAKPPGESDILPSWAVTRPETTARRSTTRSAMSRGESQARECDPDLRLEPRQQPPPQS